MTGAAPAARLAVRGLRKSYAAPVLLDLDLELRPGEVHALVGANGAGKSTLARILCGLTAPDAGRMTLDGLPYAPRGKRDAERAGVHLVAQELNLVGTLSVAENLFLSRLPTRFGLLDRRALEARADDALARVGLEWLDPWTPAETLGVGHRQLVEIAAALAHECRVLVLDEPTAALTGPEIERLFREGDRLRGEGTALVYVSHRMEEIRRIADRTTVLRDGRLVETRATAEMSTDQALRLMIGRDVGRSPRGDRAGRGPVALRVDGLARGDRVRGVSFAVHRGEVLGIAGLVGSGRTELLRAVFGADRPDSGTVRLGAEGEPLRIRQPRDAVRAGIGMVPEDRREQGLLLPLPVRVNATLATTGAVSRGGWLDPGAEREVAEHFREALDIRCHSVEQPVAELSGGNQQKALIARWLARDVEVLLFDEPTRGIDVAARAAIYRLLDELAARGRALVVVSSELEELIAISDRIAVLSAGRVVATYDRPDFDADRIMAAAFSGYATPSSPSTGAEA